MPPPRLIQHKKKPKFDAHHMKKMSSSSDYYDDASINHRTVTILQRGSNHIVALKPPSVVCHHSGWTGSRSRSKRGEEPEVPMLQRVRDAIHDIDTRRDDDNIHVDSEKKNDTSTTTTPPPPIRKVNLIHRLDRGASGALLLTYASSGEEDDESDNDDSVDTNSSSAAAATSSSSTTKKGNTAQLIESMANEYSIKTYVALVRGEGILHGEDLKQRGWFEVNRKIKDEKGDELKDATTLFNFVAGQAEEGLDRPRISLVLARPKQGRWHQESPRLCIHLTTSSELSLPLFDCLCKPHVLTEVTIIFLHLHKL